jgi:hypothetical protein
MTWTDLYRLTSDARCDLLLLDSCLIGLSQSNDAALHARVTADIPNAESLCTALDEHHVPIAEQVEARIVRRARFVEFVPAAQPSPTFGARASA